MHLAFNQEMKERYLPDLPYLKGCKMNEEEINAQFDKWWSGVKWQWADTQHASRTAARVAFKAGYMQKEEEKKEEDAK
jgi:hypothetical protein